MQLTGKVIIITGSAAGIGKELARRFSDGGALITDRNEPEAHRVAEQLGSMSAVHVDDLADPLAPVRIVEEATRIFGRVDGLVNNAAYIPRSDIHSTDVELFDAVMAVNVRAPMLLIQAALGALEEARGSVLNIGSVNAYCGEPPLLAYSMSKGALMTMTRNLGDALHSNHGIRVNQINPGWVLTENEYRLKLNDGLPEDWPTRLPRSVAPSGGLVTPETIAAGAVYWLSDASRPVSGAVLELEQYPMIGRNPPKEVTGDGS